MSLTRILIADDHPFMRTGLRRVLEEHAEFRVVAEAADGQEAVNLWQKHRPDVTLLDLRMPALDGVGAIDEIRRQMMVTTALALLRPVILRAMPWTRSEAAGA